jgi:hypothetical protein
MDVFRFPESDRIEIILGDLSQSFLATIIGLREGNVLKVYRFFWLGGDRCANFIGYRLAMK